MSGEQKFQCADCGTEINEGEYKTFGVCDPCFDKGVSQKLSEPKDKSSLQSENAALKEMIGDILASYEQYGELPSDIIDRAKKLIAENRE